jgi:Chaperone of endosialidase
MGQLSPLLANSGLNSAESGAINQLTQNASAGNPYASSIGGLATNELAGGGATAQAPALQAGLSTLQGELNPYASGSMIGNNSALQGQLNAINTGITNQVNSEFAGSGRLGSPGNSEALGLGIAQGDAPVIANQYNQDVSNQIQAANALYGAQNTTSGALTGLTQQGLSNQQQGVTTAQDALTAQNYGPLGILAAQQEGQSIPAQNLGLLAQIGIPIAGLGTNSTGSTTGTQTESGAQEFQQIAGGLGSLLGSGGLFGSGSSGSAIPGSSGPTSLGGAPLSGTNGNGLFSFLNWSDRRLKTDITRVGTLFDGTPVYRFRYIGQRAFQLGLMAQDVEKDTPEAVHEINGFKAVDYNAATEKAVNALAWGC